MGIVEQFWWAWPWMGLGMAVVMLVLLFGTDLLHGMDAPRWRDPYWLAWLAMPAYLVHQFEEYPLHITDGQYDIVSTVLAIPVFDLSQLPMAHFPMVNIALVWVGVPLAAWLGRRMGNPVVALAPFGFLLLNGFVHVAQAVSGMMPAPVNPGFFTGAFVFLPLVALAIVVCVRGDFMDGKGLAIALVSGAIGHILLGVAYALCSATGPAFVLCFDVLAGLAPMLLALLFCRIFKVRIPGSGDCRSR